MRSSHVHDQFSIAHKAFPSLKEVSTHIFTIHFNKNEMDIFYIILSNSYPQTPPKIEYQMQTIELPILKFWKPFFNLCDIINQIKIYYDSPVPKPISITPGEASECINNAPANTLQDAMKIKNLVMDSPTIQKVNTSDDVQRLKEEESQRALRLLKQICDLSKEVSNLESRRASRYKQISSGGFATPSPDEAGITSKLAQIGEETRKLEEQLRISEEQARGGQAMKEPLEVLTKMNNIRQHIIKNGLLMQHLYAELGTH